MQNYLTEESKCYNVEQNKAVIGNSVNINIKKCDTDIRADVIVCEHKAIRIWGQIKGKDGLLVHNALVKLLKIIYSGSRIVYKSIASTISDSDGFYQFEVNCPSTEDSTYKILVSKSTGSLEKVAPVIDELGNLYEEDDDICRPIEKKKCYEGTTYQRSHIPNGNQY